MIAGDDKSVVDAIRPETATLDSNFNIDLSAAIKIKQLWTFCKQASPDPSSQLALSSAVKDDEDNLPEGVPEAIEKAWLAKHGFHFNGSRLLIGGDCNRVYNGLMKKKPKTLPKMDPEKFKLTNEGAAGESRGLLLTEDGRTIPKKSYYMEIHSHENFWWKIRAFMSTVCYLTILDPKFFPYQNCENFIDNLRDVLMCPSVSGRMPLNQIKIAWKTMISSFHIKIYQESCTSCSLTGNETFWRHYWTWTGGPRAAPSADVESDGDNRQTRRLQSVLDRAENALKRQGGGGGGGGGKTGGGKATQRGDRAGKRARGGKGGDGGGKGNGGSGAPAPPPDPRGAKGASAGSKAWARRAMK